MLSFFPLDVLDQIGDLIESVSEGFLTYSCYASNKQKTESKKLLTAGNENIHYMK